TVLGDSIVEPNETLSLVLSNSAGATVRRAIATGTIIDYSRVPRIQFSAPAYVVSEAATRAVVSVRRTGPLTRTITVGWTTYDGTAQTGSDYTGASGTLTFTPGVALRTITVPLTTDLVPEPDETVLLRLSDPEGGAFLGDPKTAVLTIKNDDPAGSFSISPATLRVNPASGTARLMVRRLYGSRGTVTVDYTTVDGSAVAPTDYTQQGGTLAFAPGQTVATLAIPLLPAVRPRGARYFKRPLSTPTPRPTLSASSASIPTLTSASAAGGG